MLGITDIVFNGLVNKRLRNVYIDSPTAPAGLNTRLLDILQAVSPVLASVLNLANHKTLELMNIIKAKPMLLPTLA